MVERSYSDLLKKYNFKIVESKICTSIGDALAFSEKKGYPVVLKIDSKNVFHKTDIGGVKLNITSRQDLINSYKELMEVVRKLELSKDSFNGLLIQEMLIEGYELIVGYNYDLIWGPIIMIGSGGIFTEIIKDTVFRKLPIKKTDAEDMLKELKFSKIFLKSFRNLEPVSKQMMINLLINVSKFAIDSSGIFDSFDMNPIIVWKDHHQIIDFKFIPRSNRNIQKKFPKNADIRNMDKFFFPESIAVIGASEKKDKIGGMLSKRIISKFHNKNIYPINPKYESVLGIKTYPSLSELPVTIDLGIIVTPLNTIPQILEDCKNKNIKNIIIISGGGKEVGEREIEEEIKNIASKYSIRIIGCNCIGVLNTNPSFDTFFYNTEVIHSPKKGNISMITQSGTVGTSFLESIINLGINKFVSFGNRIDLDEADILEYFKKDKSTKVIALYLEGLENGEKFFNVAKKVVKEKPVIVYKASRSKTSSLASLSHTGFFSGTYSKVFGIFNQIGLVSVDSMDELIAASKILGFKNQIKGNKAAFITNGAGAVIQAMDIIEKKKKLDILEFSTDFKNILKKNLPSYSVIENIIDLTGSSTDKDYELAIESCIQNDNIDILLVWNMFHNPSITMKICKIYEKYFNNSNKPIIYGTHFGGYTKKFIENLEYKNIPIFGSVSDWITAAEVLIK